MKKLLALFLLFSFAAMAEEEVTVDFTKCESVEEMQVITTRDNSCSKPICMGRVSCPTSKGGKVEANIVCRALSSELCPPAVECAEDEMVSAEVEQTRSVGPAKKQDFSKAASGIKK